LHRFTSNLRNLCHLWIIFKGEKMKNKQAASMGSFLAIGIGVGMALGVALDNIGVGIALGVAIGAAIGGGVAASQKAQDDDGADVTDSEGD
jgi:hypothetical protein